MSVVNCENPLLVHRDGSMSCEIPGCSSGRSAGDIERALVRHRIRVSCDDPGRARCLECHPLPAGSRDFIRAMAEREIESIVWHRAQERVDVIYVEGEPDRLMGSEHVVADLARNVGLQMAPGLPGTVRWVRNPEIGSVRRLSSPKPYRRSCGGE